MNNDYTTNCDIKEQITQVVDILNDVETYCDNLTIELSNADSAISDMLHLIENNNLKTDQCYRVVKELHNIRLNRRRIKNDMELSATFKLHWQKLLNKDNRSMLITELCKKEKALKTEYNYRIYDEEQIKRIMGEKEKEMKIIDKFVEFENYCPTCKFKDCKDEEGREPCNSCLDEPVNTNSKKPVNYEAKNDK